MFGFPKVGETVWVGRDMDIKVIVTWWNVWAFYFFPVSMLVIAVAAVIGLIMEILG